MRLSVGTLEKLRASAGFLRIVRNWPAHYAATHLVRRRRLTYLLRNGLQLEARPRTLDVAVIKDVFLHEVYAQPGFAVDDGDVVVDVGAHIGAFSAQAARAGRGVTVLAFEPFPENYALLSANIARNGIANVTARQCAVSGGGGQRTLHVSGNPAGHSLHIVDAAHKSIAVPSLTLADVFDQHRLARVDLLKMDCEGAEYEILETALPDTLRRVRRIAMEAHTLDGDRMPARLAALLEANGFAVRIANKDDATAMVWARRA